MLVAHVQELFALVQKLQRKFALRDARTRVHKLVRDQHQDNDAAHKEVSYHGEVMIKGLVNQWYTRFLALNDGKLLAQ